MRINMNKMLVNESTFECERGMLTIRGTEFRPEGENLPAAIICHGFMANQESVKNYAKALAETGYVAYCFDFCGGSAGVNKSDGLTTEMSVLTEALDLEAVIAYVKSLPYTGDRLLVGGCSQGGFVSALVAARNPGLADKLLLVYPALCIPRDARRGRMMFAEFDPENIPEIVPCGPMTLGRCYVADVVNMDVYEAIAGYTGELALIHGDHDDLVDISFSDKAFEVYRKTAASADYCVLKDAGHGFEGVHELKALKFIKGFAEETEVNNG